eukprot:1153109-Pelagomonas_calceolata.AAC.6
MKRDTSRGRTRPTESIGVGKAWNTGGGGRDCDVGPAGAKKKDQKLSPYLPQSSRGGLVKGGVRQPECGAFITAPGEMHGSR